MKKTKSLTEVVVLPISKFNLKSLSFEHDMLMLLTDSANIEYHDILDNEGVLYQLLAFRNKINITDVAFISKDDHFTCAVLEQEINYIFKKGIHNYLTLLVPYLTPPPFTQRIDGKVQSALVSAKLLFNHTSFHNFDKFWKAIYDIAYTYLNSSISHNIEIFQIGKPKPLEDEPDGECSELFKKSLLIIPHKGSTKLLKRCLSHLNQIKCFTPDINLCFDDISYKKIDEKEFANLTTKLKIFLNVPGNVGPYLPRHYSILNSNKEFIFFQDSDDISVESRFFKQLAELKKRNLDMIGSHELRVDQFAKSLIILRNPLEVIKMDTAHFFYPLFHPTSLITKKAYLKAKGFSTDRRFGYDYQFLLRSCFILKMGNIDDFLYIRFRRPNSLTTNSTTKMGSSIRSFHKWRWIVDYGLVNADKLNLDESSLRVQKHKFDYQLVELSTIAKKEIAYSESYPL